MTKLKIHLQEGFTGDEVIIEEGGREIYHKQGVKTHPLLGLADNVEHERKDGPIMLKVSVPTKGLTETIKLAAQSPSNLGLSIQGGKIKHHLSDTEFGYM
jgi:hypothetical protein